MPKDQEVHIVLDNYATHKTALVRNWLVKRPRYRLHFTPTHSSWINQVERWFAQLSQKQIKRGNHHSVKQLQEAIETFVKDHNASPKPFRWVKSADQILASIARFARSAVLKKSMTQDTRKPFGAVNLLTDRLWRRPCCRASSTALSRRVAHRRQSAEPLSRTGVKKSFLRARLSHWTVKGDELGSFPTILVRGPTS